MIKKLLILHTLSPLHAGTGQGIGVIDLPIAREKATGIPYLPGSSIKGVLRDACVQTANPSTNEIFGAENLESAGCVQFGDARLLLLPVRSLKGTFAYVTSPYLLSRLHRDAAQVNNLVLPPVPEVGPHQCMVFGRELVVDSLNKVILEDLDFVGIVQEQANSKEGWAKAITDLVGWDVASRLCIVHDDAMGFLMENATEVVARNVLSEQKTAENLWYEESLPAESVLLGLVLVGKPRQDKLDENAVLDILKGLLTTQNKPVTLQFGGKATVGRGLAQLRLVGGS